MATSVLRWDEVDEFQFSFLCPTTASATSRQAVAGASQLKVPAGVDGLGGAGKSRFLSLADGRRGTQERNSISKGFI